MSDVFRFTVVILTRATEYRRNCDGQRRFKTSTCHYFQLNLNTILKIFTFITVHFVIDILLCTANDNCSSFRSIRI